MDDIDSAPALPAHSRGSSGHPAGGAGLAGLCSAGVGWLQQAGGGRPEIDNLPACKYFLLILRRK